MAVFAVAVATGDIIKYQSFFYGSFVWEIHVRYNKYVYRSMYVCAYKYITHIYVHLPMKVLNWWLCTVYIMYVNSYICIYA